MANPVAETIDVMEKLERSLIRRREIEDAKTVRRGIELLEWLTAEEEDDGEPSFEDEVQTVLRMLDEWAADHGDEAVFFRCRQRLRAAWRKAKGGA